MKKMHPAYLVYLVVSTVLCVAGLLAINKVVDNVNTRIAAIGTETAPAPALPAEQAERLKALPHVQVADTPKPAEKTPEPPKQETKAEAPEPAPVLLPGAGASVEIGGAPNCADLGALRQASNPTPRGSQYRGQLLVASGDTSGAASPCYRPGTYVHLTLGKFRVGKVAGSRKLAKGEHAAPGGTVTILE